MKIKILSLLLLVFLMTVSTGCSILRPEPVEKIVTKEVLIKKLQQDYLYLKLIYY